MTMNLNRSSSTTVGTNQVGAVTKIGVVEGVVACCDRVLVAGSDCKPVARIFLDLESYPARTVAFFLEGRLKQTEVVVVAFSRLDEGVADYSDAGMLKLRAKLEVDLAVKNGGIVCGLLQNLQKSIDFCPNF